MAKGKAKNPLLKDTVKEAVEDLKAPPIKKGPDKFDDHLSSSIADLESKTVGTKSTILRSINEIKAQMEDERAINEALKTDFDNAKDALSEKEKEIEELREELAAMKSNLGSMEGLKDELTFANEELKSKQDTIESQKRELEEKGNTINDIKTKLISVEEERAKILSEMKFEMQNYRDLQKELAGVSSDRDNITREKDVLAQKYKSLEAELTRLREESKALEEIQQALTDTKNASKR